MQPFAFHLRVPRVVFGAGALGQLRHEVEALGFERALVLSTPGQAALGRRAAALLGELAAGTFAGPLLDDAGAMNGSLLVIDFADRAAALTWLAAEPFTRAGVYGASEVTAFRNLWPQKTGFPEA